jgi:hypothetical protein
MNAKIEDKPVETRTFVVTATLDNGELVTWIAWNRETPLFEGNSAILIDEEKSRDIDNPDGVFEAARDMVDERFSAEEAEKVARTIATDFRLKAAIVEQAVPVPLLPPDGSRWMPMRHYPFGGDLKLFLHDGKDNDDPFNLPGVVVAAVVDRA